MSLLDHGTETLLVWPETVTTDGDGNPVRVPAEEPVTVTGRVNPVSSDDAIVAGQQVTTTYRVITRDAPLGPWARVRWRGRDWDVVGEPQWFRGSPRTRHVVAYLRARGLPP